MDNYFSSDDEDLEHFEMDKTSRLWFWVLMVVAVVILAMLYLTEEDSFIPIETRSKADSNGRKMEMIDTPDSVQSAILFDCKENSDCTDFPNGICVENVCRYEPDIPILFESRSRTQGRRRKKKTKGNSKTTRAMLLKQRFKAFNAELDRTIAKKKVELEDELRRL